MLHTAGRGDTSQGSIPQLSEQHHRVGYGTSFPIPVDSSHVSLQRLVRLYLPGLGFLSLQQVLSMDPRSSRGDVCVPKKGVSVDLQTTSSSSFPHKLPSIQLAPCHFWAAHRPCPLVTCILVFCISQFFLPAIHLPMFSVAFCMLHVSLLLRHILFTRLSIQLVPGTS